VHFSNHLVPPQPWRRRMELSSENKKSAPAFQRRRFRYRSSGKDYQKTL
jgi:hypothetical protein